jgi:hypothetical protein
LVVGYGAGKLLIPPSNNVPAVAGGVGATGASSPAVGATAPAVGATAPAVGATAPAVGSTTTPSTGATIAGGGGAAAAATNGPPDSHVPLTAFSDKVGGFYMSYPKGWTRLSSKDTGVRLLLRGTSGASLLVRLATLGVNVSGKTLAQLELATDVTLRAESGVEIVAGPRLLSVNNLPGYLYIYSYIDPTSHERSAHSQIVLFSGKRMYTLVYQTEQAAELVKQAPLFDQITDTFHAD